jgi:hypothetical protein
MEHDVNPYQQYYVIFVMGGGGGIFYLGSGTNCHIGWPPFLYKYVSKYVSVPWPNFISLVQNSTTKLTQILDSQWGDPWSGGGFFLDFCCSECVPQHVPNSISLYCITHPKRGDYNMLKCLINFFWDGPIKSCPDITQKKNNWQFRIPSTIRPHAHCICFSFLFSTI